MRRGKQRDIATKAQRHKEKLDRITGLGGFLATEDTEAQRIQ